MTIISQSDTREFATPGAVMTTLASPTLGGATLLSLWRVQMAAGSTGPDHVIDSEQLWTLTAGSARIVINGAESELHRGDSFVAPAGATRRISALTECEFLVGGFANGQATIPTSDSGPQTPPWMK